MTATDWDPRSQAVLSGFSSLPLQALRAALAD